MSSSSGIHEALAAAPHEGELCGAITVPELLLAFKCVFQRLHRQPMVKILSAIGEA
jgi:hypothetical protein